MSPAADSRPRLIAPAALLAVGALVAALLALLFPGLDFGEAQQIVHPDPLSAAYLRQVLRSRPGDREARMLLARQDQALGDWDGARAELERLAADADAPGGSDWSGRRDGIELQARLALLELDRARLAALPPHAPVRPKRLAELRAEVQRLATGPLGVAELSHLAEVALALESPVDAAALYARLASADPGAGPRWPRLAARWYRATGHTDAAVRYFLLAAARRQPSEVSSHRAADEDDLLAAVAVLRAAGRPDRALGVLDAALGRAPVADARGASGPRLEVGVVLALECGALERAQRWGALLLDATPDDARLLDRQLSVELGLHLLPAAFERISRLVALSPDDARLRWRLAEIAGWAGRSQDALRAWVWLANHPRSGAIAAERRAEMEQARLRAVALGRALFAHDEVVLALADKARAGALSLVELLSLVDALESTGDPEAARRTLESFEGTFAGAPDYWRAVTALAEHVGDAEGALRGVRALARRFGAEAVAPGREAGLLWELDRPDEALAAARAEVPAARADDVPFWTLLANLAWTEEDEETALGAYRHIWEQIVTPAATATATAAAAATAPGPFAEPKVESPVAGPPARPGAVEQEIAERLITLLAGSGFTGARASELVEVAHAAYARLGNPALVLMAVEHLVEGERWQEARALAAWGVRVAPTDFARAPAYWSAVARLAEQGGHQVAAVEAWTRAADLEPGDADVAEGLRAARDAARDAAQTAGGAAEPDSGPDPGDRLAAALERHDRGAVRTLLARSGRALTLSQRVDAELELGNDARAWGLLTAPPDPGAPAADVNANANADADAPSGSGSPVAAADREDAATVVAERQALEVERQHGLSVGGGIAGLGSVDILQQRASVELVPGGNGLFGGRLPGAFAVQGLVEVNELRASDGSVLRSLDTNEARAGLGATYREPWGDSRLRVGGLALASGGLAFASASQHLEAGPALTLDLDAIYHELPTDTAGLRVAGLRNAVESELVWRLGVGTSLLAGASAHEYTARDGGWLGSGAIGHLELGQVLRDAAPRVRVRADGFLEANRLAAGLPPSVARMVQPGTSTDSVVPGTYQTAGIGISVMNVLGDEIEPEWGGERPRAPATETDRAIDGAGRGRLRLRPFADLWAGWLLPAQKLTYTVNAGVGVPVGRRQELAAIGFFESDRAGEPGQRYAGVSLSYALRWR